jgi:hypothetical protein
LNFSGLRVYQGLFLGAMRLYFPKPEALDGTWKKKPPMTKTQ